MPRVAGSRGLFALTPVVGARTVAQLEENLGAAAVELSDAQVARLREAKGGPYSVL
jgi:aryl-alcohol dehydrogenase-like predicted oxidoreductase